MDDSPIDKDEKARRTAIAHAVERTSDIYPERGKWCFDHMWRNGVLQKWRCSTPLEAEYRVAIVCLGIAADILRYDIRKTMDQLDWWAMMSSHAIKGTPEVGLWTNWLPRASEVSRLPKADYYFDMIPF